MHVERLENLLFVFDAQGHVRGDEVGHNVRFLYGLRQRSEFVGKLRRQSDRLIEEGGDRTTKGFDLFRLAAFRHHIVEQLDLRTGKLTPAADAQMALRNRSATFVALSRDGKRGVAVVSEPSSELYLVSGLR